MYSAPSNAISAVIPAGNDASSSSNRSRTSSDTSTVLAPERGAMPSPIATSPLQRAKPRIGSSPSSTRATSRSRIGAPSRIATTRSSNAATLGTSPWILTTVSRAPDSKAPPGTSTFCDWSAVTISPAVSPYPSSRSRSTQTRISRSWKPPRKMLPTPSTVWSRGLSVQRAYSPIVRGSGPMSAIHRLGWAEMSSLETTGGSTSVGSEASASATLSRTSCAARSMSRPSSNSTDMFETPRAEVDVMCLIPSIEESSFSITSVTADSTTSGLAPGSTVVTDTVGKSTLGNWLMPSARYPRKPKSTSADMAMIVKIGLRMAVSDRNIRASYSLRCKVSRGSTIRTTAPS